MIFVNLISNFIKINQFSRTIQIYWQMMPLKQFFFFFLLKKITPVKQTKQLMTYTLGFFFFFLRNQKRGPLWLYYATRVVTPPTRARWQRESNLAWLGGANKPYQLSQALIDYTLGFLIFKKCLNDIVQDQINSLL